MRKILFSMLMGMMVLGAMAQGGKFTVKGTFEHVGDSVHFFLSQDVKQGETRVVTGEMLEVTFDLKDVNFITIGRWFNGRQNEEEGDLTFPAMPGETLVVSKDGNGEIRLGGSQFYEEYNEAWKTVAPINKEGEVFIAELQGKIAAGVPEVQLMEEFQAKVPALLQKLSEAVTSYVKSHPDQDAAAALIAELPDDLEYLEPAAALLTERARGSVAAKLYKNKIEAAQARAEEDAKQYVLEGKMAPDFTLNDINGKPLALSSLRGKWVIIDFWGSWCGWCIKGMPKMKEYYAKYSSKLEILGVDCNDTVEKWKGAVKKHELPWLHVYCDTEVEEGNPLGLYGVQGFPTKVVVDPQGMVAKIIVGEDPAFYDYLDEVLK